MKRDDRTRKLSNIAIRRIGFLSVTTFVAMRNTREKREMQANTIRPIVGVMAPSTNAWVFLSRTVHVKIRHFLCFHASDTMPSKHDVNPSPEKVS